MIDLCNPGDNTTFTRTFHSELHSTQSDPSSSSHPINLSSDPLYCAIIMQVGNQNEEPVIGSVYQCSGTFIDQDESSSGIRFSVLSSTR